MGIAMRGFRLVHAAGPAGCDHYVLLRAGRPSYPNADQGSADAADAYPEMIMDGLTGWWRRWVLPAQCRWAGHAPADHELRVTEPVAVAVLDDDGESGRVDLYEDAGLRSFDVWIARRAAGAGAVIATAPAAEAFAEEAEEYGFGDLEPFTPCSIRPGTVRTATTYRCRRRDC